MASAGPRSRKGQSGTGSPTRSGRRSKRRQGDRISAPTFSSGCATPARTIANSPEASAAPAIHDVAMDTQREPERKPSLGPARWLWSRRSASVKGWFLLHTRWPHPLRRRPNLEPAFNPSGFLARPRSVTSKCGTKHHTGHHAGPQPRPLKTVGRTTDTHQRACVFLLKSQAPCGPAVTWRWRQLSSQRRRCIRTPPDAATNKQQHRSNLPDGPAREGRRDLSPSFDVRATLAQAPSGSRTSDPLESPETRRAAEP